MRFTYNSAFAICAEKPPSASEVARREKLCLKLSPTRFAGALSQRGPSRDGNLLFRAQQDAVVIQCVADVLGKALQQAVYRHVGALLVGYVQHDAAMVHH